MSVAAHGFDSSLAAVLAVYHRVAGPAHDPMFRNIFGAPGQVITWTRRRVAGDRAYFSSPIFIRHFQGTDVFHRVASGRRSHSAESISLFHAHRAKADRDFSEREQQLLDSFHVEIDRLIGRALVSATEESPLDLPPRLRQALVCLAAGDSEKQIAARLGISPATVHQYVTALYVRFGVRGRGQLMAHILRRAARDEWRQLIEPMPD